MRYYYKLYKLIESVRFKHAIQCLSNTDTISNNFLVLHFFPKVFFNLVLTLKRFFSVITLQDVSATFFNYRKSKSFCNPLPDPRYGYVECNNRDYSGNYNIGTRCTFHCDENYELEGTSKTSCNKKGDWTSRQIPECVRNDSKLVAGEIF